MAIIKYKDANGVFQKIEIPAPQRAVMPDISDMPLGAIIQYTGETTADYTTGYFYQVSGTAQNKSWRRINVQPSGGSGTGDYEALDNKPSINSVELYGNKTSSDLGLAAASHTHQVSDISGLANVATSGDYDDLSNTPTNLSDFTNDIKQVEIGSSTPQDTSVELWIDESENYTGGIPAGSGGLPDYSTTEYKIGRKWIDGKDIYEKVVVIGTLPNNNSQRVAIGTTVDNVISLTGYAKDSGGGGMILPAPRIDPTFGIELTVVDGGTNLNIRTGVTRTGTMTGYAIIQYTKIQD